jgi:nitrite reductase (NADH) large subunit
MTAAPMPSPTEAPAVGLWRAAQWIGVVATAVLLAGLFVQQDLALDILWNVLIPLVPASLLISPAIWRNVCPLATLNTLSNGMAGRRPLVAGIIPRVGMVGIVLLVLMVPARRFVFNTDGVALALTIAAVAVLAVALGALFDLKAGFCNAICPVLPVERLYGQHPIVRIGNPRCTPCTMCTPRGCIDLNPGKSIAQTLGAARRSRAWLASGYGLFAGAFPGFVVGYYTTQDGAWTTAGSVYLHVAVWMLGSYLATAILVWLLKASAARAMVVLAAAAAGLYYWFAADTITTAFAIEGAATVAIRVVALALVVVWLWRAVPQTTHGDTNSVAHA